MSGGRTLSSAPCWRLLSEMARSRPNVGPSGRAIRCLAAGVLATLGMKILWGQLAPMGSSTLLGSGVQSGPAGSLPPWLAFTILFGLPMAVSWLISYAVLRTSAIPQPFAPDRQRRLLWLSFCCIRLAELAGFTWPYFLERTDCGLAVLRPRLALAFYPWTLQLPDAMWRLYFVVLIGVYFPIAAAELAPHYDKSGHWRSRLYIFVAVLYCLGMAFDENLIASASTQLLSMLLAMAVPEAVQLRDGGHGVTIHEWNRSINRFQVSGGLPVTIPTADPIRHERTTSAWSIGRCFHAAFYFYAGAAKLNPHFLSGPGIFSTPMCALLPGDWEGTILGWNRLRLTLNFAAALAELSFGFLMFADAAAFSGMGAGLAIAMHVLIFVSDAIAGMRRHFTFNPRLFGWSITCIVNLYVLFLHPASRHELRCGFGALSILGRRTQQAAHGVRINGVHRALSAFALSFWILPPATFILFGWGHPKWMLGMYDFTTPKPTLAYLLDGGRPQLPSGSPLQMLLHPPFVGARPVELHPLQLPQQASKWAAPMAVRLDMLGGDLMTSIDSNGSSCLFRRQVVTLTEDVGVGHPTATLLWAHHLAHLARSAVTVFYTKRRGVLQGTSDVLRSTIKYDTAAKNRVTTCGPAEVVATLKQSELSPNPEQIEVHCNVSPIGGNGDLLISGNPCAWVNVTAAQCRTDLYIALLCGMACCGFRDSGPLVYEV